MAQSRDEIESTLKDIFADMFDVARSDIDAETSPDTMPEWDSLAHVRLISAIEEAFAIKLPPEDQVEMLTFDLVVDVLADRLGA